ncbi:MAG: hypothetical protein R6V12_14910 [Candidatus Hydrogenedentota bacterium]
MTQEIVEHDKRSSLFIPDLKRGAALALVLLLGLLAAAGVSRWVQETVHRYHPLVFEDAARAALEAEDFERAVTICTGNLRYTNNILASRRVAHLLRAKAYFHVGKSLEAIADIEEAEAYWRAARYNTDIAARQELKQFASTAGYAFLKEEDTHTALRLFSLAGMGSGEPLEYIKKLTDSLNAHQTAALWSGEPYLIVEDFEQADDVLFTHWFERTGRTTNVTRVTLTSSPSSESSHAAKISASPAEKEGRSWYTIPFFMHMTDQPCRIRAFIICEKGSPPGLIVGQFFPETNGDDFITGNKFDQVVGNHYETEISIPARPSGKSPCYIVRLGLILPPEECEYLVERIVLVPGDGKESGNNGQR